MSMYIDNISRQQANNKQMLYLPKPTIIYKDYKNPKAIRGALRGLNLKQYLHLTVIYFTEMKK